MGVTFKGIKQGGYVRRLNTPCPLYVLRRRKYYDVLTKLDISMVFYTFSLDEEAQKMCIITTPFGLVFMLHSLICWYYYYLVMD